jgi:penicillin-binding protein 2
VEACFDRELSGRNGYVERGGLQDWIDDTAEVDVPPEDGEDLRLTLDLDLQRAALETLLAPEGDPNDPQASDYAWLAEPAGAIVLMDVEGDVLAAASFPDFERGSGEGASPADLPYERTLRQPTFQPPGSCFKPFVAAWALDHVRFDPAQRESCAPLADGQGAGYLDVHCAQVHGHGEVGLREALKRSCNAYFAHLGDLFEEGDWPQLAREFGFGEPTGVQAFGRGGLVEDPVRGLFSRPVTGRAARLAANGLAVVEATPMQLARATAALATGELPVVRLVERVGELEVPRDARRLSLTGASLEFVRDAMYAVANEPGGSAQPALSVSELGFRVGAKTGSGDIGSAKVESADGRMRVRKHTWLIGYFPFEAPRYVVVVFCHDTLATASHGAIWVARQFLRRPEVQSLLRPAEAK